ncbi:MAG: hypothetical protein AMS27_08635 [Bacteroides sp. SM23_62_1]|nr:MAG: hypothetical protein AMS27_08635 [Bacteroides sp. SM23_62_1]
MSESDSHNFNQLKEKIKRVIDLYEKEKDKNVTLIRENHELREKVKTTEQSLKDFKTKYDKLKIAKTLVASSNDLHDARLRVNKMVREIDRCIALLNR